MTRAVFYVQIEMAVSVMLPVNSGFWGLVIQVIRVIAKFGRFHFAKFIGISRFFQTLFTKEIGRVYHCN
jgi:hypothetical protein